MSRDQAAELRNAPEIQRAAIRKVPLEKDPLEFGEFLVRWRLALKRRGTDWDGRRAVSELKSRGMFDFLLCERKWAHDWRSVGLLRRILDELRAYRQEAGNRLIKEHFDEVDEFLQAELRRVQKKENRAGIPELKSLLTDIRQQVERARKALGWLKNRRQNAHFDVWRHFWPEIPRRNVVLRRSELDSRLQVELGKLLADYLRQKNVSLETIARLILLIYWVEGLSAVNVKNVTETTYTHRVLKVRNIRENLREHGLHKAASFQSKRTFLSPSQAAQLRKIIKRYRNRVTPEKPWTKWSEDELWRKVLSQSAAIGTAEADYLEHNEKIRTKVSIKRLQRFRSDKDLRKYLHEVFVTLRITHVGTNWRNDEKAAVATQTFRKLMDAGGPREFFDGIARYKTESDRIKKLQESLRYYASTRAKRILMALGLVKNCMDLDDRIYGLLDKIGVVTTPADTYEQIETELIEEVGKPSGISGVRLDRILDQNYLRILTDLGEKGK